MRTPARLSASYRAVGPGGFGTSPITYTDNIPAGTNCTLIWAAVLCAQNLSTTVTATVGGKSAVLQTLLNVENASSFYTYLACLSVTDPPTGSQIVSVAATNVYTAGTFFGANTAHYANVGSIGTATTIGYQSGASLSVSVASTNPRALYANAFAYREGGGTDTFSAYSQNQRYVYTTDSTNPAYMFGDGQGNGSTLTFSVTRGNASYGWGGIIVPLMSV